MEAAFVEEIEIMLGQAWARRHTDREQCARCRLLPPSGDSAAAGRCRATRRVRRSRTGFIGHQPAGVSIDSAVGVRVERAHDLPVAARVQAEQGERIVQARFEQALRKPIDFGGEVVFHEGTRS